jgi:hypothetical protein
VLCSVTAIPTPYVPGEGNAVGAASFGPAVAGCGAPCLARASPTDTKTMTIAAQTRRIFAPDSSS